MVKLTSDERSALRVAFQNRLQEYPQNAKIISVAFKYLRQRNDPPGTRLYFVGAASLGPQGETVPEDLLYRAPLETDDEFLNWMMDFVPDETVVRMTKANMRNFFEELIQKQNGAQIVIVAPSFPSFINVMPNRPANVLDIINTPPGMSDADLNLAIGYLAGIRARNVQH